MYHLAIDIGASSGRHILGRLQDGRLELEEIYRFENGIYEENGVLVWDIDNLVREVKAGIARCKFLGKIPARPPLTRSSSCLSTWAFPPISRRSSSLRISTSSLSPLLTMLAVPAIPARPALTRLRNCT